VAGQALINSLNSHATKAAVELLLKGTEQGLKWQARAAALALLGALAKAAPSVSWGYGESRAGQLDACMPASTRHSVANTASTAQHG
jgi:hypothetical protein